MQRKLHRLVILLLFFAASALPTHVVAEEIQERTAILDSTTKAMTQGDLAALEQLATLYRTKQARTSSGVWKLSVLHGGINRFYLLASYDKATLAEKERIAEQWVKTYPKSPTARLAYAEVLARRAWHRRGGGYANTVRAEDWAPFREGIEATRRYLEDNKQIASLDPEWYIKMEAIAKAQQWDDARFQALIDEGMTRYPEYYEIYFQAIEFYSPKWGGSAVDIERFARMAMERTRAREGQGLYARIYWYASQSIYDERLFTESLARWSTMRAGIDDVLKVYADEWNLQNFARFACLARDREKALELIERVRGPTYTEVWKGEENFQRCKAWVLEGVT
ncbi:cytoplasmic protein [Xanthomonas sontii]|uniref:Cytoplasmic protein n=1 Tax=Xanthomonas sontii TaxID=2650745 RepID=A0A6N7QBP7_9XANT|nr:cytoplasmic protein [Xanthomonas sontii]MRH00627.1 cytoplasmic protein [Xanthomonas sontii]MRH74959.1 cytoplasmic protein [Xanthomonas sontii]